jgi:threonine synthase
MQVLRDHYDSGRVSEDQTLGMITQAHDHMGELLCPHSAIGVAVAEAQRDPVTPMVTLATAHPAKFPDAVQQATGIRPPLPERMADLFDRPERVTRVANDLDTLETHIKDRITS